MTIYHTFLNDSVGEGVQTIQGIQNNGSEFGIGISPDIVCNNLQAYGSVDLGNDTSDTVSVIARVDSSILPSTNGNLNLGGPSNRWDVIYATTLSGSINGSNVTGNIGGNAATVTNGVTTIADQTISGIKTFTNIISGSINGNAATATTATSINGTVNGGSIIGDINVVGVITATSINGSINGSNITGDINVGIITATSINGSINGSNITGDINVGIITATSINGSINGSNIIGDIVGNAATATTAISATTSGTSGGLTGSPSIAVSAILATNLAGVGNRAVYSDASGNLTNDASDERLKENVSILLYGLDTVCSLNPVSYNWIDKEKLGSQREIGLIAQEVQKFIPEVIGVSSEETLTLDYAKLTSVLVKAIQELKVENEMLKSQIQSIAEHIGIFI